MLAMNKAVTKTHAAGGRDPGARGPDAAPLRVRARGRGRDRRQGQGAVRAARVRQARLAGLERRRAALHDDAELADALQLAFELDRVALVEPAVEGGKEINCAVLGRPGAELRVSACEQPIAYRRRALLRGQVPARDQGRRQGRRRRSRPRAMAAAERIDPGADLRRADRARAGAHAPDVRRRSGAPASPGSTCCSTPRTACSSTSRTRFPARSRSTCGSPPG